MTEEFGKTIAAAYAAEGPTVDLGRGVHEGAPAPEAVVQIPLKMMNRHGLVAGATGTGKTVTLQTIAEQLSAARRGRVRRGREGRPLRRSRRGGDGRPRRGADD